MHEGDELRINRVPREKRGKANNIRQDYNENESQPETNGINGTDGNDSFANDESN